MPQWRKLHVKILDSLDVNGLPDDFHRLSWVLLPLCLDSEGRGLDDATWLRSKLFPLRRDVTPEMIEQFMVCVTQRGMIERYEVDGRHYFQVPTFHKYQATDRETRSIIPAPDGYEPNPKIKPDRSWISEALRHYDTRPGVYLIQCTATGKVYVGASENVAHRLRDHLRQLNEPRMLHPMAKDFRKYGPSSITIRIYRYVESSETLKEVEAEAMATFSKTALYNRMDSRHHWKWLGIEPERVGHATVTQRSTPDGDIDVEEMQRRGDSEKHAGAEAAPAALEPQKPVKQPGPAETADDLPKRLCAAFEAASGIRLPAHSTHKGARQVGVLWWRPLREMAAAANGHAGPEQLMRRAVERMRAEKLTIQAPRSVQAVFTDLAGQHHVSQVRGGEDPAEVEALRRSIAEQEAARNADTQGR